MTFTKQLVDGLAAYLAAPGDSPFTWKPDALYGGDEFGIWALTAPLKRDRRSLVITPYYSSDDFAFGDSTFSIQLDYYGTKLEVVSAFDYAFDRLQGLWSGTLGGIKVQTVQRTSATPMGIDETGNYRYMENYDLAVHRPSTHRL